MERILCLRWNNPLIARKVVPQTINPDCFAFDFAAALSFGKTISARTANFQVRVRQAAG